VRAVTAVDGGLLREQCRMRMVSGAKGGDPITENDPESNRELGSDETIDSRDSNFNVPTNSGSAGRTAFRAELLAAGLLLETGVDGLYGRSRDFETIVDALESLVIGVGADQAPIVVRFPPVIPRQVIERTDYLRSFPNLVGAVHTFDGADPHHADLLALIESDGEWSVDFVPSGLVLCSAACQPLYPTLTGSVPAGGQHFDVFGWVFRHEPSLDPGRMQMFRQYEFVFVGEPDAAVDHRDLWVTRGLEQLMLLGLDAHAELATDPFFGRAGRLLSATQRADRLKYELVCAIGPGEGSTALVSCNYHMAHFGEAFSITIADGSPAHSSCVGFGMERIAMALFHAHGFHSGRWPAKVRAALWP
jgi:seryl-tRNA synthetase